jgi:hypothetical protein
MSRLEEYFAQPRPPAPNEVNEAFWHACSGGQPSTSSPAEPT